MRPRTSESASETLPAPRRPERVLAARRGATGPVPPHGDRTRRRSAVTAVAALSVLTLVAACDGQTGDGGKGSAGTGVLTIGMPNGPQTDNSNPFLNTSAAASLGYRNVIYEPLGMPNLIRPEQRTKPWLASKWTWAPDFKKVTLTVRKGPKWSDGKPLTADDVAYTFELMKKFKALNTDGVPYDGISVRGDTVELTFPESQFVNQAKILDTFVVPKHIWSKVKDPTTYANRKPVGTGPYTLKTFTPQTVTLTRTKTYWKALPEISELRYTAYNDNNSQTTALASGKAEWSWVFMPNAKKLYVDKDPAHHKMWFPAGLGIDALWFNTAAKPFDDVALRRAVNKVIDRKAISVQAESGLFPEMKSPTGLPMPAGASYLSSEYKDADLAVDVAGAKKILEDAGYTGVGSKLKDPDGKPVTFELTDPAGWADYLAGLAIIKDDVKKLGIDAEVRTQTVDAWTANVNNGKFDATFHWTNSGATPYDLYDNIMNGTHYEAPGKPAPGGNFGRFKNDEATEALKDYANAPDDAARKTALDTVQKIFVEQVPAAPTAARPIGAEFSTKHWTGWPDERNPYGSPQPTQVNALDVVLRLRPAS